MPERHVAIAIATYRRPEELGRLLHQFPGEMAVLDGWTASCLIIIDNDPSESARPVADSHSARMAAAGLDLVYQVETRPGISNARNAAIDLARPLASHIAFLDDDETLTQNWPAGLMSAVDQTGADVVGGPVVAIAKDAPDWMRRPHFLEREDREHLGPATQLATNNILIRIGSLDEAGLQFDPHYGLTGGSDALLTRQLSDAGYQLRWAADAVLSEVFPDQRVSLNWLRRRWYRNGVVMATIERQLSVNPVKTQVRFVFNGVLRMGFGIATMPLFLVKRSESCLRRGSDGLRQFNYGRGLVVGSVGGNVVSYGPDGSETEDR